MLLFTVEACFEFRGHNSLSDSASAYCHQTKLQCRGEDFPEHFTLASVSINLTVSRNSRTSFLANLVMSSPSKAVCLAPFLLGVEAHFSFLVWPFLVLNLHALGYVHQMHRCPW